MDGTARLIDVVSPPRLTIVDDLVWIEVVVWPSREDARHPLNLRIGGGIVWTGVHEPVDGEPPHSTGVPHSF